MEIRKGICIIASTNAINMNRQIRFILFLFIVSLTACQKQSHILPLLQEAETLMDSRPDSSLCLLESVQSPENLSAAEYATWCLLVTQARDKNYVEHTSDSVIGVAVRYFEKYGPQDKYGKSLYYKGRVCQDLGKREDALTFYLKARDEIEELKNYNLLFLICSHLGTLYGYLEMKEEALSAYQESYKYAVLDKDSSSISYSLSYIGRVYGLYKNWDSSIANYKQAVRIAESIRDSSALWLAMKELSSAYIRDRKFNEASTCLSKIDDNWGRDGIVKDLGRLYLTIGNLYRLEEDYDNAAIYLNKALETSNIYTRREIYLCFYYLYETSGEYKKAIDYNNLYKECADAIQANEYQKNLREITAKYENEKLLNANTELKWKQKQRVWVGILILMGLILSVVYLSHVLKQKKEEICSYQDRLEHNRLQIQEYEDKIANLTLQMKTNEEELKLLRVNSVKNSDLIERKEKANIQLSAEIQNLLQALEKLNKKYPYFLLADLREKPYVLADEDWKELFIEINIIYVDFIKRLQSEYPLLTFDDIKYCCLFKLSFSMAEIALMMNVKPSSVSRRKLRIKEHFQKMENFNLETYIHQF